MAEAAEEPPSLAAPQTSKPKSLQDKSKDELVRDFKKLTALWRTTKESLENIKSEKESIAKQLAESEERAERLQENLRSAEESVSAAAGPPLPDHARIVAEQTASRRLREDLEAARETCSQLRSQLDDARTEVLSLRESKATADVFSLELGDYEKKVSQLSKELRECREALADAEGKRTTAEEELRAERRERGRAAEEGEKARENADEMRREAHLEKARLAELQLALNSEKSKTEVAEEELTRERVALGRQLAACQERATRLEECVEALREENGRLRMEREGADGRAAEIAKEFEAFKVLSRVVLEKQTKEKEKESPRIEREREDNEKLQATIKELHSSVEMLRDSLRRCEGDLSRVQDQCSRAESERRAARKEADENAVALANALDEVRTLRVDAERAREDASTLKAQLSRVEAAREDGNQLLARISREMEGVRERAEEEKTRLGGELAEEKRRREEAIRQLEERRRRDERRAAPVAAVYPQFTESSVDRPPSAAGQSVSGAAAAVGGGGGFRAGSDDVMSTTCERSLEDVLFGEEASDEVVPIGDLDTRVGERVDGERVARQLLLTREMLLESEEAAARMADQISVLKEEIRRLERNAERKGHLEENTEYLKNVVIKFLTPERVSGERAQLLPILCTMLRLSHDEMAAVQEAAVTAVGSTNATSDSWGSYLHRWSGLS